MQGLSNILKKQSHPENAISIVQTQPYKSPLIKPYGYYKKQNAYS